jgi:exonuclease III
LTYCSYKRSHNLHIYTTHYNIGTTIRGTTIVTWDEIQLAIISKIPSGRAISAKFREAWIINIYATTGTAFRQEREEFYNSELAYLLRDAPENIILGGEFNCILKNRLYGHLQLQPSASRTGTRI